MHMVFAVDAYGVRRYEGLVPEWDASNPIHLVGHRSPSPLPRCRGEVFTISNANVQREYSYGGNTALELQRLLHEQVSPLNRTVASAGCPTDMHERNVRRTDHSTGIFGALNIPIMDLLALDHLVAVEWIVGAIPSGS